MKEREKDYELWRGKENRERERERKESERYRKVGYKDREWR
jgi:hypothetical protein